MANEPLELFEASADSESARTSPINRIGQGVARVLRPNRAQIELRPCDWESTLAQGHRARIVWAYVAQADLSRMYEGIRAVEGGAGRAAIAPEILFALWLYATLEGVGSARAIARLAQEHDA
jgi:transposase